MKLKVMLDPGAKMPTYAHETDAGMDLYSPIDGLVYPGDSLTINTGVHMSIPSGFCGLLVSKSGLNVRNSINNTGLIDADYTGSIVVKLYNQGSGIVPIEKGQKISQMVILPVIHPELVQVYEMEDTERGTGGFGSTGKF